MTDWIRSPIWIYPGTQVSLHIVQHKLLFEICASLKEFSIVCDETEQCLMNLSVHLEILVLTFLPECAEI